MSKYTCKYCFRNYRKKENHDKHATCCEFFHRSIHENDNDSYENLPSQRQMFHLLQEVLFKCNKLEKELEKIKNTTFVKQRKLISEYLNQSKNIPTMNFIEWSKKIDVEQCHLETVFQDDLTEGMKECIKSAYSKCKHLIPIRAFTQKQNTLYIYNNSDETPDAYTWKIMSNDDIDKFISILSYKFLQEYMKFQRSIMEELENNEDMKENHIIYMIKINGGNRSDERRRNEIKKIMYLKLQEDIQHLDITF
jgi:hypothetical protein